MVHRGYNHQKTSIFRHSQCITLAGRLRATGSVTGMVKQYQLIAHNRWQCVVCNTTDGVDVVLGAIGKSIL